MEQKRILELAIETLEKQKAVVDAELAAIRAELNGVSQAVRAPRSVGSAGIRKRKSTIKTRRKTQSQRIGEYRSTKGAQAKNPAAAPKNRPVARTKGRRKTEAEKKTLSIKMKEAWKRRKAEAAGAGAAQEIEAASKEQEA